jgi:hypothetical protein
MARALLHTSSRRPSSGPSGSSSDPDLASSARSSAQRATTLMHARGSAVNATSRDFRRKPSPPAVGSSKPCRRATWRRTAYRRVLQLKAGSVRAGHAADGVDRADLAYAPQEQPRASTSQRARESGGPLDSFVRETGCSESTLQARRSVARVAVSPATERDVARESPPVGWTQARCASRRTTLGEGPESRVCAAAAVLRRSIDNAGSVSHAHRVIVAVSRSRRVDERAACWSRRPRQGPARKQITARGPHDLFKQNRVLVDLLFYLTFLFLLRPRLPRGFYTMARRYQGTAPGTFFSACVLSIVGEPRHRPSTPRSEPGRGQGNSNGFTYVANVPTGSVRRTTVLIRADENHLAERSSAFYKRLDEGTVSRLPLNRCAASGRRRPGGPSPPFVCNWVRQG